MAIFFNDPAWNRYDAVLNPGFQRKITLRCEVALMSNISPFISAAFDHCSTRIFQWKNPASLRLRAAKGLLNLSRKENVSQTLSSSTSGLNPLPLRTAKCGFNIINQLVC